MGRDFLAEESGAGTAYCPGPGSRASWWRGSRSVAVRTGPERHGHGLLIALPLDADVDLVARLEAPDRRRELVGRAHRVAVHRDDDVTGLHAGVVPGGTGRQAPDERAAVGREVLLLRERGGDLLGDDAEER